MRGSAAVAFAIQLHHLEGSGTGDRLGTSSPELLCGTGGGPRSSPQPNQAPWNTLHLWEMLTPPWLKPQRLLLLRHGDQGHQAPKHSRSLQKAKHLRFHTERRGHVPSLLSPSSSRPPSYLPHGLHLREVPPAEPHPAPSPVGVVHLLSWHPGLGLAVRRDGDAVLPALERRGHLGEGRRRAPHLAFHEGPLFTYVQVGTAKVCPNTTRFPSLLVHADQDLLMLSPNGVVPLGMAR